MPDYNYYPTPHHKDEGEHQQQHGMHYPYMHYPFIHYPFGYGFPYPFFNPYFHGGHQMPYGQDGERTDSENMTRPFFWNFHHGHFPFHHGHFPFGFGIGPFGIFPFLFF